MDPKTLIDKYFSNYVLITNKDSKSLERGDRYPFADKILKSEFIRNDDSLEHIYKKVVLLNSLYSTNIFATFDLALHIYRIDRFRERVETGDRNLIEEIRHCTIGETQKNFYSFATKYCHHHNPNKFPIFDKYVEKMLLLKLRELEPKTHFDKDMLKKYPYFLECIDLLCNLWHLGDDYKYEKLDKYLWQKGKELANS